MNKVTQVDANKISTDQGKSINHDSVEALSKAFLRDFPKEAARKLESLPVAEAAEIISRQQAAIRSSVWTNLTPATQSMVAQELQDELALSLLKELDSGPCATTLSQMSEDLRNKYLDLMPGPLAQELRELLDYPPNSAGYLMDTRVIAVNYKTTVRELLQRLNTFPAGVRRRIYLLDDDLRLRGQVSLEELVCANKNALLDVIAQPITTSVLALDPKDEVAEKLQKSDVASIPVLDIHLRLLGVIRGHDAYSVLKQDISADLQSMVGASREERALSSSLFAVKKRQPWLQINLLTGFLAAAVVGLFESTIAQFTALAVLMPVAAGQSGNTGAQALAVTMRGLTLREITARHWFQVMFKEASAGFINGIAIAITCGLGVYLWSKSVGLAAVLALAMIISMTVAGIAGALVPIILKRLGQDPAQSSSIILTTVTDIAGFMSFLGIATALSSFLA